LEDNLKVCLVTGAASGVGKATANMFAARGFAVVFGDIDANGGAITEEGIRNAGGQAAFLQTDVSKPEQMKALVDLARERFGRLDCAVNNAGIEGRPGLMTDFEVDEVQRLWDVNFMGVFLGMKYEIPLLVESGGGAIVNVGSSAGHRGTPHLAAYSATKHALVGLTKSAALEFGEAGVRINIIAPGSFHTPMSERVHGENFRDNITRVTPLRRIGTADEIAETIYWLGTPSSSFVTGATLAVDGGKLAGPVPGVTALWRK
jgi:NAD(P)-dependent dehydrogenase (short-subunit alcohol dehydrogenase family)